MNKIMRNAVFAVAAVGIIGIGVFALATGQTEQANAEGGQKFNTSKVWAWPPPATEDTMVEGASARLNRSKNGISYAFDTAELEPGVHTMWIVAFNDPSTCEGGCGADDLMAGRGDSAAFWDGGLVVGPNGRANFAGHVQENSIPVEPEKILKDNTSGVGIENAETTEVHLVLRTHGPAIKGGKGLNTQLKTFNGACQPNPDSCKNVQFSVHIP